MPRSPIRLVVAALALPVALVGLEPAAAAPDRRTAATEARVPTGAREMEVGGGLMAFELPRAWKVDRRVRKVPPPAYLRVDEQWAVDDEQPVVELARVSGGDVQMSIGVERLPVGVDEATWRRALLDRFVAVGATIAIEAPATFGGQPSQRVIGELDGSYLQLDFAEIDSQLVAAQTRAADTPDADAAGAIDELLDSVAIDESVLSPVQNALDARIHVSADETGDDPVTVSTLVPFSWEHDPTAEVGQVYEDPTNGGESFAQLIASRDVDGLQGEIQRELDEFATESFFDAKPTRERARRDGVPIQILWDGAPGKATRAAVYGTDGVIFFSVYMAAEDNELLHTMIDELVVIDHN